MESVNILRLKTGEDIICYMEHYGHDEIIIRDPMVVLLRTDYKSGKQNIGLDHWLPAPLLMENEALINMSDVLTVLTPSSHFSEYYVNAVNVVNNLKTKFESDETDTLDSSILTQEDMSLILESMDTSNTKVVH